MYSLYRAWFGDDAVSTSDNYPRLQDTLSPPDTLVRVGTEGEHQFVAHKGVLSAHSGYLKALLANAATTSGSCVTSSATEASSMSVGVQTAPRAVTSVSVSSIGGEAFAPLLHYMYTGRLEVTTDNVYSVLLATHLLHMPGALEQCRAALLRLRAPPLPTPMPISAPTLTAKSITASASSSASESTGPGRILRPIPNRLLMGSPLCWPQPTPLYPSPASAHGGAVALPIHHLPQLQPTVLMQTAVPPSVSVIPAPVGHEPQDSVSRYSIADRSHSPKSRSEAQRVPGGRFGLKSVSPEAVSSTALPFVAAAAAAFSALAASATTVRTSPSPAFVSVSASLSPSSSSRSPSPSRRQRTAQTVVFDHRDNARQRDDGAADETRATQSRAFSSSKANSIQDQHAADNSEGTSTTAASNRGRGSRRRGRGSAPEDESEANGAGVLSVVYDVACCDGPVRFHRVLNKNYASGTFCGPATTHQVRVQRACTQGEGVSSENDENGGPPRDACTSPAGSNSDASNGTGTYTCGYCRHTFKSQYCYRKHTKRHLLPTRTNSEGGPNRPRQDGPRNRREVRLLDLNVQYYPCKICGCKFPSYYFVHKHRKLCHADAEERPRHTDTSDENAIQEQTDASGVREASP